MAADDVLSVENLSVDFRTEGGRLHALRNVSLAVPRGKIVGVVGESGCGRSGTGSPPSACRPRAPD